MKYRCLGRAGFSVVAVIVATSFVSCGARDVAGDMFASQQDSLNAAFARCRADGITEQQMVDEIARFEGENNFFGAYLCLRGAVDVVMARGDQEQKEGAALINSADPSAFDKLDKLNERMGATNKRLGALTDDMGRLTGHQKQTCVQEKADARILCRLPEVLAYPAAEWPAALEALKGDCGGDVTALGILKLYEDWLQKKHP